MLKELSICNLILIESETLSLVKGMNVLSGESGSGKTAILNALKLISGMRADSGWIRHGSEKAAAEALFDIEALPHIPEFLHEKGIDCDPQEYLIIKREHTRSGRGRAFINHQHVALSLLKELSAMLFDIVGQHANKTLLSRESHRDILDQYGDFMELRDTISKGYDSEHRLHKEIINFKQNEAEREYKIDRYTKELKEIEEASIEEGEEEMLFAEYKLLFTAKERAESAAQLQHALEEKDISTLKSTVEQLLQLDPQLKDTLASFSSICLEMQEMSYALSQYQSSIEFNPMRIQEIEERLTLIKQLQRKYQDIFEYETRIRNELEQLQSGSAALGEKEDQLKTIIQSNEELCETLSKKRAVAALSLENSLTEELKELNMEEAKVNIQLQRAPRNRFGLDIVTFFLAPNAGEPSVEVQAHASGGELSRLLLAIHSTLAGKQQTPTLLFDEVDANIGGKTASRVGEKLSKIGRTTQVICITHFPQVAKFADHHLRVEKQQQNGRTFTVVTHLSEETRIEELARMSG
ncbi:MAG: DNA repair protein RecN [Waddliaceae bacterium]